MKLINLLFIISTALSVGVTLVCAAIINNPIAMILSVPISLILYKIMVRSFIEYEKEIMRN